VAGSFLQSLSFMKLFCLVFDFRVGVKVHQAQKNPFGLIKEEHGKDTVQ
jgi:hypothetical protein